MSLNRRSILSACLGILLPLVVFISCRKDKGTAILEGKLMSEILVFGIEENVNVKSHSGFIADVNEDGNSDLELQVEPVKSGPGPMFTLLITLKCLNTNIGLRTETRPLTVYTNTIVSITSGSFQTKDDIRVFKTSTYTESCEKTPGAQVKFSEENRHFIGFNKGESASLRQAFVSGSLVVQGFRAAYNESVGPATDTVYIHNRSLFMDCRQDFTPPETYFCFKLIDNGKSRLGWIKVVSNPISISEIAIQK